MSNLIFPLYKQSMLDGDSDIDIDDGTVKAALVTSAYTYSSAHQFYSDISANVVGTPQTVGTTTVANGLFDGDNVTYTAVAGGSTVAAIVFYIDTGVAGTSRLVAIFDTGVTGLPVVTNGGDISVTMNASGIFQL